MPRPLTHTGDVLSYVLRSATAHYCAATSVSGARRRIVHDKDCAFVTVRLQCCATRLPFSGLFSASPLARNPSSRFLVKKIGPSPANEAALQYIVFKYVSCARDIRKLLACLHDKDSAPNLIIITDDLSTLLGAGGRRDDSRATPDAAAAAWGGSGAGGEAELSLTLAHLKEALFFCDSSHSTEGSRTGGGAMQRRGDEIPSSSHANETDVTFQGIRSQLLVAEGLSDSGLPKMLFVYEKFINGYFTLHCREGDGMGEKATAGTPSGRDRVCAIGSGLGGEEEGEREWEMKQVNHRRFHVGNGIVKGIEFKSS